MTIQTKMLNAIDLLNKVMDMFDDATEDWQVANFDLQFKAGESVPLMTDEQLRRYNISRQHLLKAYNLLIPLVYQAPAK